MWEFVSFLRRMTGRPLVRDSVPTDGESLCDLNFWHATPSMMASLNDIVGRAGACSRLSGVLPSLVDRVCVSQLVAEELASAAYRDGLAVTYEDVRAIVCDRQEGESFDGRIVANAYRIFSNIARYDGCPLGVEFFRKIEVDLFDGIPEIDLAPYRPACTSIHVMYPDRSKDKALDELERNGRDGCAWGGLSGYGSGYRGGMRVLLVKDVEVADLFKCHRLNAVSERCCASFYNRRMLL